LLLAGIVFLYQMHKEATPILVGQTKTDNTGSVEAPPLLSVFLSSE